MQPEDDQNSVWTSYSDLFMAVAIVFLVLFIFALLQSGVTSIKSAKKIAKTEEYAEGLVPKEVKAKNDQNLEKIKENFETLNQQEQRITETMTQLATYAETIKSNRLAAEELQKSYMEQTAMLAAANKKIATQSQELEKLKKKIVDQKAAVDEKVQEVAQEKQIEIDKLAQRITDERLAAKKTIADLQRQLETRTKELRESQQVSQEQTVTNQTLTEAKQSLQKDLEEAKKGYAHFKGVAGDLESENTELHKQLGTANSNLASAQESARSAKSASAGLQQANGEMSQQIDALKGQVGGLEQELTGAQKSLAVAQQKLRGALAREQVLKEHNQMANVVLGLNAQEVRAAVNPETGAIMIVINENFHFANNSSLLNMKSKQTLRIVMAQLHQHIFSKPEVARIKAIDIQGHASPIYLSSYHDPTSRGPAYEYNLKLSRDRAEAVRDYLSSLELGEHGMPERLAAVTKVSGLSFSKPIKLTFGDPAPGGIDCGGYDCVLSRRVEIDIQFHRVEGQ